MVLYDSEGHFQEGDNFEVQNYDPRFETPRERINVQIGAGVFRDKNDKEWAFAVQRFIVRDNGRADQLTVPLLEVLIASPRPKPTLRYLLDEYGGTIFMPLCQAGFVGMLIAMLLSLLALR
ncbi:MAG: hypothetical protein HC894_21765 [Microcoleus sp. SM1_3_4]|nr:hypothetical protein [Microcoleus sp. SM1_3_4]